MISRLSAIWRWFSGVTDPRDKIPNVTIIPSYPNETTLETVYSRNNNYRVAITRDSRGIFRMNEARWILSDYDGKGVWEELGSGSLTDTLEIARTLAQEKLRCTPEGPQ
jgi:hypothetical protein